MLLSKLVSLCGLVLLASTCHLLLSPRQGTRINERWEASNGTFRVRVTAYAEENGGFVAGAYYVFESALVGSENWGTIMTVRHDDPVPIPREQVHFVNDQVGYAFMLYKYAVTTDGGASWFIWDAVERLPSWRAHRAFIGGVWLEQDGMGKMVLTPLTGQAKAIDLYTRDYGRNWGVQPLRLGSE